MQSNEVANEAAKENEVGGGCWIMGWWVSGWWEAKANCAANNFRAGKTDSISFSQQRFPHQKSALQHSMNSAD